MKKIFTLLILAALFAIPRSAQAVVEWEIADGVTDYRINPENPSDPNDSIIIPAGTKFVRVMCGHLESTNEVCIIKKYIQNNGGKIKDQNAVLLSGRHIQAHSPTGGNHINYEYGKRTEQGFVATLHLSTNIIPNFPDDALRLRLAERIFGYNFLRITYGSSLSDVLDVSLPPDQLQKNIRYLYKIVLTEEEVLRKKSLNFDPQEYGITIGAGIKRIDGLEIFANLEELYLQNNDHFATCYDNFTQTCLSYEQYQPNFMNFPKLKILDLSDIKDRAISYGEHHETTVTTGDTRFFDGKMPELPQSIEYIGLRNSVVISYLFLSSAKNPNLREIDATGNQTLKVIEVDGLSLDTISVKNASILEILSCNETNIKQLDVSGCQSLRELYCRESGLESLTFDNNPFLHHVECQNNNLYSLSLNNISSPPIYDRIPSVSKYYQYDSDGNGGIFYKYRDKSINATSGDTLYRWEKRRFDSKDVPSYVVYSEDDGYYECYSDDYDAERGKYIYIRYFEGYVSNPTIPVDYVRTLITLPKDTLSYVDCSNNSPMTSLTLPNNVTNYVHTLYCYNNNLTSLDLTACTSLKKLRMSHNKISQINISNCTQLEEIYARNRNGERGFSGWNHGLTSLDCSGLKNLHTVLVPRNKMTSLNMSGCEALRTLQCEAQGGDTVRLLDTLNLTGCTNLTTLECQNNGLTSLDLSATQLANNLGTVKAYMQRNEKDVVVIDRDKVCIELVNGVTPTIADNGTISDADMTNYFGTWDGSGFDKNRNKVIKRNGKTYLVIHDISSTARGGTQRRADVDFYGKQLKYQYAITANNWNETLGGSAANSKKTDNVTVTTYPYVMYINPATLDKYTDPQNTFYSGTIYLDYDAVVPPGTEVYIAQGLQLDREGMITGGENTTSGQLNLVKIEKAAGATNVVIPAYTPVYVKSPSETGLFDFARNLNNEPLATIPSGNIFKGTLRDTTVTPYDILTLSRGYKTGGTGPDAQSRVGFWRFNNTLLPAHRVYIEADEMDKVNASGVRGLTFAFFDSEADLPTSIDRMERVTGTIEQQQRGWYTVSGIRLKDKPTAKGVYIHNGKKVFIN